MKQRSSFLKKASILSMLFLGLCSMAIGQRTISGTITDASTGEGLIGANILVVGSDVGTSTDIDGSYNLDLPAGATRLEISYTGYTTQTVDIGTQVVIDIAMAEGSYLDEIVVTGYGTQKQKEVTSAIVVVDAKDFNRGNINNATEALQGKVPGLSIYNKGGNPNSSATIRLRGISTVGANSSPLIVVDGVVGASLNNVDPSDIQSINVLKDGSGAAIYGSRGSSGVILVTTKGGARGSAVSASYNGYVSSASVDQNIPVMNKAQYIAAGGNDLGYETDWQDAVTQNGISHVHNIAVSGGTENTTYRLSTNLRDVEGVLRKSGFNQINARANINHYAMNDRLKVNFNMALTHRKADFSFNESLRYAALYNPTAPVRFDNDPDAGYFQAILFDNFNPVAIVDQNTNEGTRRNLNFNTQITYDIIADQLSVIANYGQQYETNLNGEFYPRSSFFRGLNRGGLANRYTNDIKSTLFESYLKYDRALNNVDLSVTAGYSFQEDDFEDLFVSVGDFPSDLLGFNALELGGDLLSGTSSGLNVSTNKSPSDRIIAFFGRVNLNFDDAISVSASLRREGSTKLGADNQWGLFPSIGVGVDINRYANIAAFDALRLRVGYGVTGALPSSSGLSQDLYAYNFGSGGTVDFVRAGNPDLQWEEKAEINVGLDFAINDYTITGTLDFYNREVNDFILERAVEISEFGTDRRIENGGKLSTTGFELSLTYNGVSNGDFSWTPNVVLSTYKTTLDEFSIEEEMRANLGAPGQNGTNMIRVAVGENIGQIWAPVFAGVDSEGNPTFADINGDGSVVADGGSALADNGDFQEAGNGIPTLELGFNNQFTYKNWDLNAFFRGAFGHSLVNTFRAFYEPIDPGAINSYNRIITDKAPAGLISAQFSSLYVEKADFVKLDNLTLGYNFDVSGMTAFQNVRAYISVQNVFTITDYTGIDPEPVLADFGPSDNGGTLGTNPDVLSPGIDRRNNYFTARTFTLGLNVGF